MNFNVKDTVENQIYFHLSIQIESAEESTAKQPEGRTENPFVMYVRFRRLRDSSQAFARLSLSTSRRSSLATTGAAKNTYLVIRVDLIQMLQLWSAGSHFFQHLSDIFIKDLFMAAQM